MAEDGLNTIEDFRHELELQKNVTAENRNKRFFAKDRAALFYAENQIRKSERREAWLRGCIARLERRERNAI